MTRREIETNLTITPWRSVITYENGQSIEFRFSSELYKNKFNENLEVNRFKIENLLSNRYNFNIQNEILSDLHHYMRIEQRGFLVILDGEMICQRESLKLNGGQLMKQI